MGWVLPVLAAGVGVAAVAAGTALTIESNAQDQAAINAAEQKAVKQEKSFENQGQQVFQQALPKSTAQTAAQEIEQGAQTRKNVFNQLQQLGTPITPTLSPNASTPTQLAQARSAGQGNAWGDTLANAQGRVQGRGDWATSLGVTNADVGSRLGVINNEARGTAALLPLEVQVASHKGDALSGWGQIVSAIGAAALSGAGAGAGAGVAGAGQSLVGGPTNINTTGVNDYFGGGEDTTTYPWGTALSGGTNGTASLSQLNP